MRHILSNYSGSEKVRMVKVIHAVRNISFLKIICNKKKLPNFSSHFQFLKSCYAKRNFLRNSESFPSNVVELSSKYFPVSRSPLLRQMLLTQSPLGSYNVTCESLWRKWGSLVTFQSQHGSANRKDLCCVWTRALVESVLLRCVGRFPESATFVNLTNTYNSSSSLRFRQMFQIVVIINYSMI